MSRQHIHVCDLNVLAKWTSPDPLNLKINRDDVIIFRKIDVPLQVEQG